MGASTSVVVALIFIGFIVVATTTYSSFDYYNNLVKKAQYDQDTMKKAKMQTDITIINVTNRTTSLNLTLQNTGKTMLNASALNIFIAGVYYPSYNLSPPGNTWPPKNYTNITIQVRATIGDRIKIVTENGIADYNLVN